MTKGALRLTYGEMRSNAEKIADEALKKRILSGIEVLNEKFGPDWVEHIDPGSLDLASPNECVLGQVYDGAEVTEEQWRAYSAENGWGDGWWEDSVGYNRGLAILNAGVATNPIAYGFEAGDESYEDLGEAWLTVFGEDI